MARIRWAKDGKRCENIAKKCEYMAMDFEEIGRDRMEDMAIDLKISR
jgi:Fe-S-cluster containining protein